MAGINRFNPAGDTHPGKEGPNLIGEYGEEQDATKLVTEELPGFGVVFHNRPGTPRETYLSFKSGHYHGDQLAFHYGANARPTAVDHYSSYHPRAGQEHMHNRVAFHTDAMPYANMDGYERVIAFKTSTDVDISVGQVESERLRGVNKLPLEAWNDTTSILPFKTPLIYRRTVVAMKNGAGEDYFVMRDQNVGPDLYATYCLHVLSDKMERKGQAVDFGNLTLFCATPAKFDVEPFDWQHSNGGKLEATKGVRLITKGTSGEFITVLYPGSTPPPMSSVPNGVKVGDDVITFGGAINAPVVAGTPSFRFSAAAKPC